MGILAYGPRAEKNDALVTLVARVFQLSKLIQARDLGGAYNLNILLGTATGPYVLRAYRPWVLDERLAFLQHVKYIIQRSGLPVPLPRLAKLRVCSSTGLVKRIFCPILYQP